MRVFNKQIATAVPMDTDSFSPAVPLRFILYYCIAAIVTGTPTGTIYLQASNDPETNDTMPDGTPAPQPVNWVTITNSPFVLSSSGETMWNVRDIGYNYVRVGYTDASGGTSTATMTIIVNCKGM
jgi:hypothetical protein